MAGSPPARDDDPARLTGARAEFAASLPRRLEVVRAVLRALTEEPSDAERKQALVRRLHALGSAARVLGFASVAEAVAETERVLERPAAPAQRAAALAEVARAIDVMPSLLLGSPMTSRVSEPARSGGDERIQPVNVLVFGTASLAAALGGENSPIEVERTEDRERALELARVSGPNLVIVDADRPEARELLEGLAADPLVERVPVLVVGNFAHPGAAAAFVALGAERVLPKPVSPDVLSRTALELCSSGAGSRGEREPLGNRTVEQLVERISLELKKGLVESLEAGGQTTQVAFAEGTDVLAAVWGAIARVRELVTLKSSGAVRFLPYGPEGGVPVAPWMVEDRRAGERGGRTRRGLEEVGLSGRRLLVADDDPAVVWFLSDLLRAVGAEVTEAHDGQAALERTFEIWPDLVISDVLMPGRDGFSLCHEIHRDVAVRDVPVILLSWKEDLLQRVRELGADANGYLRKETAASTVVERVREVLVPRARVEQRLKAGGEVRGRLDGLTPRLLLELVCRSIPNASVTFRDAVYLHEAHVRDGRVRSVSRSASDGSFERGPRVLAGLLGVNSGRFVVQPDTAPCRREFDAPLNELLSGPIGRARAALSALGAESLPRVLSVSVDAGAIGRYLECTPASARKLIERLMQGAAPRDLLIAGDASIGLLESVLSDLARRGAIDNVERDDGPVRLSAPPPRPAPPPPAASGAGGGSVHASAPVPPSLPPEADLGGVDASWSEPPVATPRLTASSARAVSDAVAEGDLAVHTPQRPLETAKLETQPLAAAPAKAENEDASWFSFQIDQSASQGLPPVAPAPAGDEAARSALADEIVGARPSLLERAEAKTETMTPSTAEMFVGLLSSTPGGTTEEQDERNEETARHERPPSISKSLLPEQRTNEDDGAEPLDAEAEPISAPRALIREERVEDRESDASLDAGFLRDSMATDEPPPDSGARAALSSAPLTPRAGTLPGVRPKAGDEQATGLRPKVGTEQATAVEAKPGPKAPLPNAEPAASGSSRTLVLSLLAFAAAYALVRWGIAPLFAPAEEAAAPVASVATASAAPVSAVPAPFALKSENLAIEPGVDVGTGNGLIEIVAADRDALYVDGTLVGRGPRRLVPSPPGPHEIRVARGSDSAVVQVAVAVGRRVRVSAPGSSP
jgi:CheY-like chemotaxis protein/HPt (histidine-containing phosphotransfer) domain-containing protein